MSVESFNIAAVQQSKKPFNAKTQKLKERVFNFFLKNFFFAS
jgi:hypothetical protein